MTRRERLERKAEKRREWAQKREADAQARFAAASKAVEHIPLGQPILIGHHSEKRHRADLNRCHNNMSKGCESAAMAEHHESKANGIERQLERTIFSDDPDAIESLEEKVAKLEAQRDEWKALNAYWRKHKTMRGFAGLSDEAAARLDADIPSRYSWEQQPIPKYRISNIGNQIRTAKERIEFVKQRQARSQAAEQSENGVVIEGEEWIRVTFAEKPDREILDALRAAGFQWGAGSWGGRRDKLPACVTD
jgi:Domain of unknown function (DUF3560)